MGVSTDICYFLFFCRINLDVLLFIVLANNETVVDFCAWSDEEHSEFFDLL